MRRALATVMAGLLVSVAAFSYWDDVPDTLKTQITTYSYDGSLELTIKVTYNTEDALYVEYEPKDDPSEVHQKVRDFLNELDERWPGRMTVMVGVIPNGTQYFFPWNMAFTQGNMQYDVDSDSYAWVTKSFIAGQLREGVVAVGVVVIPEEIDLSKEFRFWYDDKYAVMPALQNTQ